MSDRPHGGVGSAHTPGRGVNSALDVEREMRAERAEQERRAEREDQRLADSYQDFPTREKERVCDLVREGMSWKEAIREVRDTGQTRIDDKFND